MSRDIKLRFGLNDDGDLIHIKYADHGQDCNLVCPECGSPLIAANRGRIVRHHFKHDPDRRIDTDCSGGIETAVHLAAKNLIKEYGYVTVPEHKARIKVGTNKGRFKTKSRVICPEHRVDFDDLLI